MEKLNCQFCKHEDEDCPLYYIHDTYYLQARLSVNELALKILNELFTPFSECMFAKYFELFKDNPTDY